MNEWDGVRRKIGRYEVINEIGSGGFSNVYHAHDPVLDREVAIKVMRPFLMSEPEFVIRFQREAKTAANLDHPNIVAIYDHGEAEGQLYIVMKLIPGGSLAIPLAQGPLAWEQVVSLTRDIAAALDYAHERSLIHRDIKPENILLDERGLGLVADFGVVKALENSTTTLSMSGGILGSPAYIAPEIWNGQPPTGAADIYALSCLVFEMVTGRKLYDAPTPPAAMALHFRPRQYPESWPENTPPGLKDVLDHGLAQNPERRFQTASELAKALASLKKDRLAEPYEALLSAIEAQKWPEAIELAETISAQDDDYRDVRGLLAQASRARAESERVIWVNRWRDQATEALEAGEWTMALTAARQWLQLSPDDTQAKAVIKQASEAQEEGKEQAAPEEPATEATPDPLAETYAALQQADDKGDWKEAYALAEKIVTQDPNYRQVQEYMARAWAGQEAAQKAAEIDRLKSRLEAAVAAGNWASALNAAKVWQELAPDDPAASQSVQQAEQGLKEATIRAAFKPVDEKPAVEPAAARTEPAKRAVKARPPSVSEYFANYWRRLRSGEPSPLPAMVLLVLAALLVSAYGGFPLILLIGQAALVCTIALGAFFVLILGEIDLSVATIPAMVAMVVALLTSDWGLPGLIAILAALILAALVGLLQGWVISRFDLPSYMVTLAGTILMFAITAAVLIDTGFVPFHSDFVAALTQDRQPVVGAIVAIGATVVYGYLQLSAKGVRDPDADLEKPRAIKVGQIVLLGVVLFLVLVASGPDLPLIAPILLLLLLLFWVVADRTRFGANIYAIGRDKEAAAKAGIDVRRMRLLVFALSGLMAGAGGVILTSRAGGADLSLSLDMVLLLMVITAAVIGGTSVFGGWGQVIGVFLGSLLLGTVEGGVAYMGAQFWSRPLYLGLIFVLALAIDNFLHRRRLRSGLE